MDLLPLSSLPFPNTCNPYITYSYKAKTLKKQLLSSRPRQETNEDKKMIILSRDRIKEKLRSQEIAHCDSQAQYPMHQSVNKKIH